MNFSFVIFNITNNIVTFGCIPVKRNMKARLDEVKQKLINEVRVISFLKDVY